MNKKLSLFVLMILMTVSKIFAGGSRLYIKNYNQEDSVHSYNGSIYSSKYTFEGYVIESCTKLRVVWSPTSFEAIDKYFILGKPAPDDGAIDDFVLKQYKKGDCYFKYNVSGSLDNLQYGSNFYRFIAYLSDGDVLIYDQEFYVYDGGAAERAKPVIYLYPKKSQKINVKVNPEGGVTESIPDYGKGWTVNAAPDGVITDIKTKKKYPYLFWESKDNGLETDISEGFVVETENLKSFFEDKLSVLGLNEKEIADFNEYWIPELQGKKYVFITFYPQERIDREAPLTISPKPDSVIRVYFDHKKLNEKIDVKEQALSTAKRHGFAVVEWGGKRYR